MIFGSKENKELEVFANLLQKSIVELFFERGQIKFSQPPVIEKKKIFDYEGRMRVDGMEKFDHEPTYLSCVNYYMSPSAMEKKDTLGGIVVYVKQTFMAKIMKRLGYPPFDDDNDDELRDSCGTLCNIIAGRFKSEVSKAGYIELEMSHFYNFRNSSFGGVEFCTAEYSKYEESFYIDGVKQMVVEFSIGTVPKLK